MGLKYRKTGGESQVEGSEQGDTLVGSLKGAAEQSKKALTVHWDDLPEWQKDNHYIISGYVPETSSLWKCIHSLSYVHNETGNIYTHLLPGLVLLAALILGGTVASEYYLSLVPEYLSTSWRDHAAFTIFVAGCATCLGMSGVFHCLKSHSEVVASFGNKLDYFGIVVLIQASMVSMIYYGLYDHPKLQSTFWGFTSVLGLGCTIASLSDRFRTPEWRPYRATMFVLYGLSGVLPVVAGVMVLGFAESWNRSQLPWLLSEAFLYISGAGLYAARVPERFKPGAFDLWGHSHQIFHVLVLLAAFSHGKGLLNAYHYIHTSVITN
uniref:ARAD1D11902p n=1 Tax=Blastobotrys adeninivorans TaxID=409370 RepID=A0A060T8J4_BLAAD